MSRVPVGPLVDDEDPDLVEIIGTGATELEAVKDLFKKLENDYEPRAELNAAFAEWWRARQQAKGG